VAQRQELRTSRRQADRKPRLTRAFWTLVFWGARLSRLSQPPVPACTQPPAEAYAKQPARRLGTGYSWHKPFLRRPPSSPTVPGEGCAKKCTAPLAHELRNEAVEELTPDLVGESRAELKVELMRDGRNNGMEGEKGRR
jgi:hypothetical protein